MKRSNPLLYGFIAILWCLCSATVSNAIQQQTSDAYNRVIKQLERYRNRLCQTGYSVIVRYKLGADESKAYTGTYEYTVKGDRLLYKERPLVFRYHPNGQVEKIYYKRIRFLDGDILLNYREGPYSDDKPHTDFNRILHIWLFKEKQRAPEQSIRIYEAQFLITKGDISWHKFLEHQNNIAVTLSSDETQYIVRWKDSGATYAITVASNGQVMDYTEEFKRIVIHAKVTESTELKGIHLPIKVEWIFKKRSTSTTSVHIMEVVSYRVGNIKSEELHFEPPDGVEAHDHFNQEIFTWRRIGSMDEQVARLAEQLKSSLSDIGSATGKASGESWERFCGVHALLLVCHYFDIASSSKELVRLSDTTYYGTTTLYGLQRAARIKGLEAIPARMSIKELVQMLRHRDAVAIAVARKRKHHVFVTVAVTDGRVVIVEPPTRVRMLAVDSPEFQELWSGVVVIFKPSRIYKE